MEMRLHLGEFDEIIPVNEPDIEMALADKDKINQTGHMWAEFECAQFTYHRNVTLRLGHINHLGEKERAISTRRYYIDHNGVAKYMSMVHP